MVDDGARSLAPSEYLPTDELAYLPGSPVSAWLGQAISKNIRWLDANTKRSFGEAFLQNSLQQAVPTLADPNGVMIGPYSHYGTPTVTWGIWYVRLAIPEGATVIIVPFVSSPAILKPHQPTPDNRFGEKTYAYSDGLPHNYGPIVAPLVEGPCRLGLIAFPTGAAVTTDTGTILYAEADMMTSVLVDGVGPFAELSAPYPLVRYGDGADYWYTGKTQIKSINARPVLGDSIVTVTPMLLEGIVIDQSVKPDWVWETTSVAGIPIYSVYFTEYATIPWYRQGEQQGEGQ